MPVFDWPAIRAGFERGVSPVDLARTIPQSPSRQAIEKRAKKEGWTVAQLPVEGDKSPVSSRDIVLMHIRQGANLGLAAKAAGISERTLYQWRQDDPTFDVVIQACRAAHLTKHMGHIDEAAERDWKAAAYLLERAPETKDQYSQKHEGGNTTIVLRIDRTEGVTIDGHKGAERAAIDGQREP